MDKKYSQIDINRNNTTIWRVIATYLIVFLHSRKIVFGNNSMTGWYIMVEFFFMMSGFWMTNGVFSGKYDNLSTGRYVLIRIKRLYPHIFFTCIIMYVYKIIHGSLSIGGIISIPFGRVFEFIPFTYSFIDWDMFGTPYYILWYVNALIVVSVPVYYMISRHRDFFVWVIAPIAVIGGYRYMFEVNNNVNDGMDFLRAFSGMCLGCIICNLITIINEKISFSTVAFIIIRFVEYGAFATTILLSFIFPQTKLDFYFVFYLAVSLSMMFIYPARMDYKKSQLVGIIVSGAPSSTKIIKYLGSISYAIYLNHMWVQTVYFEYANNIVIYTIILTIYSAFTNCIVEKIGDYVSTNVKSCFINVKKC